MFSGTATTTARAGSVSPALVVTSTPVARLHDRRHRRLEARLELAPPAIACEQRPRAALDGDAAAGVLREREARAAQHVPADDRERAGLVREAVRERLALGQQHRRAPRRRARARRCARGSSAGRTAPWPSPPSSGAYGFGSASSQPATNRFQPALGDRVALGRGAGAALAADPPARGGRSDRRGRRRCRLASSRTRRAGWCQCTQPPPYSISWPFQSAVQVRPPRRSFASSSSALRPASATSRAAVTPANPPPITITSCMTPPPGTSVPYKCTSACG